MSNAATAASSHQTFPRGRVSDCRAGAAKSEERGEGRGAHHPDGNSAANLRDHVKPKKPEHETESDGRHYRPADSRRARIAAFPSGFHSMRVRAGFPTESAFAAAARREVRGEQYAHERDGEPGAAHSADAFAAPESERGRQRRISKTKPERRWS